MSATLDQTTATRNRREIDRFPKAKAIFNICAITIMMLILNLYPDRVGIWRFADDATSFVPVLNAAFLETWLPWFNLWWVLALSLNIVHLSLGRWTLATRILDIVVIVFGLNIILIMIFSPSVAAISTSLAAADIGWTQVMRDLAPLFDWIAPWILVVVAIAVGIDLIRKVIWLVRSLVR